MDISGTWAFELDPNDVGMVEGWHSRELGNALTLPGSLQAQGHGDPVGLDTPWVGSIFDDDWYVQERYAPYRQPGNIKVPFWLQPETYYKGAAWYQREITIPAEWAGQRVTVSLERTHWHTQVWLDDQELGSRESLSVPHVYDLGAVSSGTHRLTIRVDNRLFVDVGPNAHSVSDHTQTNWNGIVGSLRLEAGSPVWIDQLDLYPNAAQRDVRVIARFGSTAAQATTATLSLQAQLLGGASLPALEQQVSVEAGSTVELVYALGDDAELWDEFHPAVYELTATLNSASGSDTRTTSFGLRDVAVAGTQITVNGRPIFLRGTLECCIFPLTGYPPTDEAAWERVIGICQAHGLNHIRFHSWCPPEAAFRAADRMGMYFQIECATWANQGSTIGEGQPLDTWLYEEGQRIVDAYGNHPSFLLMAYGNEPAGKDREYLAKWVAHWRAHDPRHLHTSGAGWPAIDENQYHNIFQPRIQLWGAELNSRINGLPPETETDYRDHVEQTPVPIVSHEIGQWCVYPNFDEIAKYTGHLHAHNFEIFRDTLNANHMGDQSRDFLHASGKLQALCYKEEIESALRTPGFGGFHLLDLHDFPGQGTALVGVLDPFWDEKGYITASEYSRFCNSVVPLARLPKRYWHSSEILHAQVDLANYGPAALENASIDWRLVGAEGTAASGSLNAASIPTGGVHTVGTLDIPLEGLTTAQKYTLVLEVADSTFANDWDLWLFADALDTATPEAVLETSDLDTALAALAAGGTVLFTPPAEQVAVESVVGFSSVFWNTSWTKARGTDGGRSNGQAPHTLGIVCNPQHPAFASFPTEGYSNWQWWELIHGAAALHIDELPGELRPLVQPIDTWFENRRLGLLFEATVGTGKLAVCSMDLSSRLDERLVARQFRSSLLGYMAGASFAPTVAVAPEALRGLLK